MERVSILGLKGRAESGGGERKDWILTAEGGSWSEEEIRGWIWGGLVGEILGGDGISASSCVTKQAKQADSVKQHEQRVHGSMCFFFF